MDDNLDRIGRAMQAAWSRVKKAQSRMWSEWMVIGDGLLEGRHWAMKTAGTNKPEGKGFVMAYSEWLHRYKVDDMDKSDRAKLLQLMEERPAVEEWRASLPVNERRNLNNPTSVWRKWTAATRVKKPKRRTTDAVEQKAQDPEQLQARIEELEQERDGFKATAEQLQRKLTTAPIDRPAPDTAAVPEPDSTEEWHLVLDAVKRNAYTIGTFLGSFLDPAHSRVLVEAIRQHFEIDEWVRPNPKQLLYVYEDVFNGGQYSIEPTDADDESKGFSVCYSGYIDDGPMTDTWIGKNLTFDDAKDVAERHAREQASRRLEEEDAEQTKDEQTKGVK